MTRISRVDKKLEEQADKLYEKYGKPLEAQHLGAFVAISPEGDTVIGATIFKVLLEAAVTFGPGNFIFKIGEKVVGKWR